MYQKVGHIHPPSHTTRARAVLDALDNLLFVARQKASEMEKFKVLKKQCCSQSCRPDPILICPLLTDH